MKKESYSSTLLLIVIILGIISSAYFLWDGLQEKEFIESGGEFLCNKEELQYLEIYDYHSTPKTSEVLCCIDNSCDNIKKLRFNPNTITITRMEIRD